MHLDRARRAGKPLIISRLQRAAAVADADSAPSPGMGLVASPGTSPYKRPSAPIISAPASLLLALAGDVLIPGLTITVPDGPVAAAEAAAAAATPGAAAGAGGSGCAAEGTSAKPSGRAQAGKMERPEELVPELLAALAANPKSTKNKVGAQGVGDYQTWYAMLRLWLAGDGWCGDAGDLGCWVIACCTSSFSITSPPFQPPAH